MAAISREQLLARTLEDKRKRRRELAALPIERKLEIVRELQLLVYSCGRAPAWWVKDFAPKPDHE